VFSIYSSCVNKYRSRNLGFYGPDEFPKEEKEMGAPELSGDGGREMRRSLEQERDRRGRSWEFSALIKNYKGPFIPILT